MKKIFTLFAAVMVAASMFAGYGIRVNGSEYHEGTQNPNPGDPSFQEYMVLNLALKAGDQFQLWDPTANNGAGAGWAVDLDGASVETVERDGDHYKCTADGCYDFYIKLKYNADQLYVGPGSNCGDEPGPGPQPGDDEGYWYWKGHVDGKDIESEVDGGKFDCGISEIEVQQNAYIFVVYQVHGVAGVQYMATSYVDGPTHATLTQKGSDKLHVPAGNHTLYLYDNGDGTVELAFEAMAGKTLMGCGGQHIDNTVMTVKARKVIINGQLRIVRGDRVFDATGKEL